MRITPEARKALRTTNLIVGIVIGSAVSIIPPVIYLLGGDYWPWVWPAFTLSFLGLVSLSIVAVRHYHSPGEQAKRAFHEKRRAEKTLDELS